MSASVRSLLAFGDRRTVGRVDEVVASVLRHPAQMNQVVECLFDEAEGLRMRAADALEKISRERSDLVQPHAEALLGLLVAATQQEVRWHLAVSLPRLQLKPVQQRRVAETLQAYLDDRSSIVKTCALQGLADLTVQLPSIRAEVIELLQDAVRRGTPAMRARGRRLLGKFERGAAKRSSD